MIGTGVFTSVGFQALGLTSPFAILMLWLVGGVLALFGALTYGEVAARIPRSGGEYAYLREIYHPALGFLSGFVSLFAGFAAPIAAAAHAFGDYIGVLYPAGDTRFWAMGLITAATLLHSMEISTGAKAQNVFTVLKVSLITVFVVVGMAAPVTGDALAVAKGWAEVPSGSFAVSLVYVALAYSGWNAAVYITGEVKNPRRNVPRALLIGTGIVTVLYVGLNYVFLRTVPLATFAEAAMNNQTEFGTLSADVIFGSSGGRVMSGLIALGLVSSVSSMVMIGPRVTATAGEDFAFFGKLSRKNSRGMPAVALWLQWLLAVAILWTQTFGDIVKYVGFTLSLFTFLTVLGVFILRRRYGKEGLSFKVPGYPVVPIVFLAITGWMLYYLGLQDWRIAATGLGTLAAGGLVYLAIRR